MLASFPPPYQRTSNPLVSFLSGRPGFSIKGSFIPSLPGPRVGLEWRIGSSTTPTRSSPAYRRNLLTHAPPVTHRWTMEDDKKHLVSLRMGFELIMNFCQLGRGYHSTLYQGTVDYALCPHRSHNDANDTFQRIMLNVNHVGMLYCMYDENFLSLHSQPRATMILLLSLSS